jgi:lipopolysaccharide transport system ATP-binding protein
MRGRVGALIALGAGFNPILTGRENIYINGSVLGLSKKEIDEKMEEIIDFAEIGEFIDSPVQNYSSGMQVRLGFAIASSLSPDVLILDEVLAVGDIGFVIKCLNRVRQLSANSAVILVSHTMQWVSSFCTRVIYMNHGSAALDTVDVRTAIDRYLSMVNVERVESGTGAVELHSVRILACAKDAEDGAFLVNQGQEVEFALEFTVREETERTRIMLSIDDESANHVMTLLVTDAMGNDECFGTGRYVVHLSAGLVELNAGKYSVMFGATGDASETILTRIAGVCPFQVSSQRSYWSKFVRSVRPTSVARID